MSTTPLEQAKIINKTMFALQGHIIMESTEGRPRKKGSVRQLTLPQLTMLAMIHEYEKMSLKNLALAMNVSSPSASAMVERLVDYGALSREPGKNDRREISIQLTESGKEAVEQVEEITLRELMILLERIGPSYAQKWCEVFTHIYSVFEEKFDSTDDSVIARGAK